MALTNEGSLPESRDLPVHRFVAVDIETTGLEKTEDDIIEIGAVRFDDGEVSGSFQQFVNPGHPIPLFIRNLTGITDEMLRRGCSIREGIDGLQEFCEDLPIVCHNSAFDIPFINESRKRCGYLPVENETWDTLELSRIYLPFEINHKLETLVQRFDIELPDAHRALHDASATGHLFLRLLEYTMRFVDVQTHQFLLTLINRLDEHDYLAGPVRKVFEMQRKRSIIDLKPDPPSNLPLNILRSEPENPPDEVTMESVFSSEGKLAARFPGYEFRPAQQAMAIEVEQCLNQGGVLLTEAGTGVGKSLAYLVPSIQFTRHSQQAVVIATNTRNLQDQLFQKDLPVVRDDLELPFTAVIIKGRENYLCYRKWLEIDFEIDRIPEHQRWGLLYLPVWVSHTQTGDIEENRSFSRYRYPTLWKRLSSQRFFCSGRKCPSFRNCFLQRVRAALADASIVIANHSLVLMDMMRDNPGLPECRQIIFDEAHNLMDNAARYLGSNLSYPDFQSLFYQMYTHGRKKDSGHLVSLMQALENNKLEQDKCREMLSDVHHIVRLLHALQEPVSQLFTQIGSMVEKHGNYNHLRIKELDPNSYLALLLKNAVDELTQLRRSLKKLYERLDDFPKEHLSNYQRHKGNLKGALGQLQEQMEPLQNLTDPDFESTVYWFSAFRISDRDYPNGVINSVPLNVDQVLKTRVYPPLRSVVFTSATISLRGRFRYFIDRMGLRELEEEEKLITSIHPSPFDYKKQSQVITPSFLPKPKDPHFHDQTVGLLRGVLDATRVGTLILFTAYRDLNIVYERLAPQLMQDGIRVLAQGKGRTRTALLDEFKAQKNAVLLGTSSFWEGIDVPGESLSLLILYKLPFSVPTEPVVEAVLEKLHREGKDSFTHYMLPNALLRYRQGFGRLIRNKRDRGVVLVMDDRMFTKPYGHFFMDIIPTATRQLHDPIQIIDLAARWFRPRPGT